MNPSEVRSAEIKWGVSHQCLVVVVRLYISTTTAPPAHEWSECGHFRTSERDVGLAGTERVASRLNYHARAYW